MSSSSANEPTTEARRELALAAREALADTHAREARALRGVRLRKGLAWSALGLGLIAAVVALALHEWVGGAIGGVVSAGAGVILALPRMKRRWAVIRRAGLVGHAFEDEAG